VTDDFFSFDEALSELRLKEEELKRLVSEGEIRAFRDGETMKLRKGDVEALRSELGGGEVVDLGESSEEIVFEDDLADEAGMATEEISDVDTIIEDDIEDVGEIELEEETVVAAAPVAARRSAGRAAAADEPEQEPRGILAVCIITTLVLIGSLPLIFAVSRGEASGLAKGIAGAIYADKFAE
jgi:excisionase family DNA binding protein